MTLLALVLALVLLSSACASGVSPGEAPREQPASAVTTAPPVATSEGPFEIELDGTPPRSPTTALESMPGRAEAPAHAEHAAWSTDGRTFVHCHAIAGPGCTECRFVDRDGTAASLESGSGCSEAAVPRTTLDARLTELGVAPPAARWQGGADVVLVIETREHEETNAGQPRPMLKLGARRRDGGPPAWLLHVDPCQGCGTDQVCAAAAHLDALALSPDGEALAVLIHQRRSQGDESLRVELLEAARVAKAARAPASRASSP
jgi:hypothetical protein